MQRRHQHCIIKPVNMKPKPDWHEDRVAELIANFFDSDIKFIPRKGTHTPDILVVRNQQRWEIKGVRGNSKNTMNNLLKGIYQQSENIIVTLLRTDMSLARAIGGINQKLHKATRIKRVILIAKNEKIIVIKS